MLPPGADVIIAGVINLNEAITLYSDLSSISLPLMLLRELEIKKPR
jgi:hypothetical protein